MRPGTLKSYRICVMEKIYERGEGRMHMPAASDLQHWVSHDRKKPLHEHWVWGEPIVLDRRLKNAVNMGKHSPRKTHLLDTRESTLERDLMRAANVGNSSAKAVTFSNIRPYTRVKGLTNAMNA